MLDRAAVAASPVAGHAGQWLFKARIAQTVDVRWKREGHRFGPCTRWARSDFDRLDHGDGRNGALETNGDHAMLRPDVVADQVDRLAQPAGRGGDVHVAGHRFAAHLDVGRIAAGLRRLSRLAELQPHVIRLPWRHGKVGGEVAAVDPVAVKLGIRRAAHLVELRLRPERGGHQVGKRAQAHDELGGRAPDLAGGIDVVFAADVAEDHPLRPGRAAALAETVFPLCGRPLDGVQVDPRAG